ncbi:MAG: hypothetical protein K0R28_2178, partial [Paenibacillus sp.]|nr:hypothetical protein [Paenibacillus sp.]
KIIVAINITVITGLYVPILLLPRHSLIPGRSGIIVHFPLPNTWREDVKRKMRKDEFRYDSERSYAIGLIVYAVSPIGTGLTPHIIQNVRDCKLSEVLLHLLFGRAEQAVHGALDISSDQALRIRVGPFRLDRAFGRQAVQFGQSHFVRLAAEQKSSLCALLRPDISVLSQQAEHFADPNRVDGDAGGDVIACREPVMDVRQISKTMDGNDEIAVQLRSPPFYSLFLYYECLQLFLSIGKNKKAFLRTDRKKASSDWNQKRAATSVACLIPASIIAPARSGN